ncbi:MAG TPA: 3-phenylpropionate/cinnamic acid dioxygenase subunit beta [Candidatus Acidoferrales bacterium]|nr:3-phenylpropionate/cinnamic acid dioxygenase subunit beta [Candidatus Acidoferrales bacterium]
MSDTVTKSTVQRNLHYYQLKQEVEEFLYAEADLLDQRKFREWLELLAENIVYSMPLRRNVRFGEHAARENTRAGQDICWFDEDKWTLSKRVEQLMTGIHWAEEPLSRTTRFVSNVQLLEVEPSVEAPSEVRVRSRFLIERHRVDYEAEIFIGTRTDLLRKSGEKWEIARREILMNQTVFLAKNLTIFI